MNSHIDNYISKSEAFAKPILTHLRKIIHTACPDVEETVKWSFPHFMYKKSILCSMASFKQHCAFTFWLASQMEDTDKILLAGEDRNSMGHLGQLKSIKDIPSEKILAKYIKQAMVLIDKGVKLSKKTAATTKELAIPDYFIKALKQNKKALINFENFNYTNKKEYVEWIAETKTEDTRNKRIEQSVEWLAEGKIRNWKDVSRKS
jgi:uncharacterized protein YdeI (YjbR/CyaY-like superfamily)